MRVFLVANGIGVPHQVQPVDRQSFAKVLRREKPIYHFFVGIWRSISDERIHLLDRWRQAHNVQREPTNKSRTIGLADRFDSLGL